MGSIPPPTAVIIGPNLSLRLVPAQSVPITMRINWRRSTCARAPLSRAARAITGKDYPADKDDSGAEALSSPGGGGGGGGGAPIEPSTSDAARHASVLT